MNDNSTPRRREAARFWEPRRLWYNSGLFFVVILWLVFTWPHFRPVFTLEALGKMLVLALLANICYCAAYPMDWLIQALSSESSRRWFRWAVWALGMLLALLIENYWIADEIYPDVNQTRGPVMLGSGEMFRRSVTTASNMNFPAPLAVLGFLAASIGLFAAVAAVLIFWFARKPRLVRVAAFVIGSGAVLYLTLLLSFSASSRDTILSRGQEKYFCEIDCHLAYSVVEVKRYDQGPVADYIITLRTRFDETTTSSNRPEGAPLTPSPREVRLIDSEGHEYSSISTVGTSLITPLIPASSYTTQLEFKVSREASGLRLLIETVPDWPDRFVIGDENSLGHKKTYFAL
ncbi:MAG TPA: hypothetical protein VMG82_28875 [Candidatus Sulfotelmatobacter sp.]|nr:hypothetical protein [Candidatus Sulfotelmatobacter sp.]